MRRQQVVTIAPVHAYALLARAANLLRPHRLDLALELEAAWWSDAVDVHVGAQAADAAAQRAEAEGDRSGARGYEDLATVLERMGRTDDARAALEQALERWERKRCLPDAGRTRERIDSLVRVE